MLCEELQPRILDYQENQLPLGQRKEVEAHLAVCAGCQKFARDLQRLDVAFFAKVKPPVLSADFDRRLEARIRAAPTPFSAAQQAQRKRQLLADFEAGMARIDRGSLALDSLLRALTSPALATAAGWLAWRLAPQFSGYLDFDRSGALGSGLLPCLAAITVFVAAGLAEAFPRPWKTFAIC
jgi:anti-sigma factor RsiW